MPAKTKPKGNPLLVQRRRKIRGMLLKLLERGNDYTPAELANEIGTTVGTIKNHITELEQKGVVEILRYGKPPHVFTIVRLKEIK